MTASDLAFSDWVAEARAVGVLDELGRRGVSLKRAGSEMVGPCPVCGGRDRFGVHVRKGIWHCRHAGRGGDAIALVQYLDGADFLAACETLAGRPPPRGEGTRATPEELAAREEERRAKAAEREAESNRYREEERRKVYALWQASLPIAGTPAAAYLARRGIPDPHSRALRVKPNFAFCHGEREEGDGRKYARVLHRGPALVAAITAPDAKGVMRFRGLHMTWIDLNQPKGKVLVADPETGEVLPAKKMRGSKLGGVIELVPAWSGVAKCVYAAEGIETLLSVWAGLVAAGADLRDTAFLCAADLGNLAGKATETIVHPTDTVADKRGYMRRVHVPGPVPDFDSPAMPIPPECTELVLLADGDSEPFFTRMAMERACARHAAPGRLVRVAWAPPGKDFNDVLMEALSIFDPGWRSLVANGAGNAPEQGRSPVANSAGNTSNGANDAPEQGRSPVANGANEHGEAA
ncbi:DUF7146 domain-containing protein [Xanthobacter aminoxidans]|uniref:DUF7146 domain-containing protein n=1 Tax=Xanthobacter aminoxidans TaxID=186280 RepID=UPI0020230B72|nr:CHC2 zinc finger domain-containing protein [Xanthobacter aminoxidans]MCL8385545.1 CHC2 zinc finger domain-containing protein [Xanthobacter aminoxidans]